MPDRAEERLLELLKQCRSYHRRGQHVRALDCYRQCIAQAATERDPLLLAMLLAETGGEHRDCDNYDHAIELLVASLALIPDDDDGAAASLRAQTKRMLAITFGDKYGPEKPEVLMLLEESRADCVASGNLAGEANVLQHIGGCYLDLGRLEEADLTLGRALDKAAKADEEQLKGWIFNDMARLEFARDDWGQALELARRSRAIAVAEQDREAEAHTFMTEAQVQHRMGDWAGAMRLATQALTLYTGNDNLRSTILARRTLAQLAREHHDLAESRALLDQALNMATRLHLERLQIQIHLDLAELKIESHDYEAAHQHAITARSLAEEEHLEELLHEADDLLRRDEFR
jgi:tetratricopeptide (TPR) repeat protein